MDPHAETPRAINEICARHGNLEHGPLPISLGAFGRDDGAGQRQGAKIVEVYQEERKRADRHRTYILVRKLMAVTLM